MRKFMAAAVPALLLMAAAGPGHAQTGHSQSSRAARADAVANDTMDSGARDIQASRAMIGKRVVHRHGGPVAGTIQTVTTDAQGQTMVELRLAKSDQTIMLPPASFERRGNQVIVMQDARELQQLAQYSSQANTGYGSSTGGTMGGQMGGSMGNMGSGAMNRGTMDNDSMNQGTMNQGSINQGTMGNGTMNRSTMSPNQPAMGQ